MAYFRSYRDDSTRQCLAKIWPPAAQDPVYPDLAFSLPNGLIPTGSASRAARPVVSLGLMIQTGRYSAEQPEDGVYPAYLDTLAEFARWLLAEGYDIRLVIGDVIDMTVIDEFKSLLRERASAYDVKRISDETIASSQDFIRQLASADFAVATRFHNVLVSLLLKKPVIAISFHHKCSSLMQNVGLSEYCLDMKRLNSTELIERFRHLRANEEDVRSKITQRIETYQESLREQYERFAKDFRS